MEIEMFKTRYIPEGYSLFYSNAELKIEVWVLPIPSGQYLAQCFVGKAIKPAWFYRVSSESSLQQYVEKEVSMAASRVKVREQRKAARSIPVNVNVGDIFKSSWGFEQTNTDYFEVTKVVSPTMIEVTPIAAAKTETGYLCGQCTPVKGSYYGEPMRKKVTGCMGKPYFKVESYASASLLEPTGFENGQPVYPSAYWSAYA